MAQKDTEQRREHLLGLADLPQDTIMAAIPIP
jgi:hypothetical protein